ncbi:ArsC/Spx/MgsR family protein [Lactococcus garvieae]|uniref:ArsC/Spx/MgsR family protein n=1 Tax=Lactococcus garvieae TaxID=1363 RepID=UPI00288DE5D2|nr:ArsC/Spx/MgsR family protein [Lactococcus garvieae]MDT2741573.1 ArsC/Spx/MgsR family protein [Lactococcus garvieae]
MWRILRIYYRSKCKSSQKAFMWLERYGINFEKQNISQITVDDLLKLLTLTTEGVNELIKNPERVNPKNEEELEKIADMKLQRALYYLKMNTSLFKTPIILDENNYMVGYNSDEIRRFFPREYRKFLSGL